jgi:hypothetical protein
MILECRWLFNTAVQLEEADYRIIGCINVILNYQLGIKELFTLRLVAKA